jgi:hypothetical protein
MKKLIIAGVLAATCMFAPGASSQETMPARQTIRYFTIFLEKELTREVELVSITVPPGSGNPFHRHPGDQWTAVQDGEVTFTIKGQPPSRAQGRRPVTSPGSGTNYYFANAGNDSNPCSSAAPCQTLHKINTMTFQSGDTINLKGGDTFTDYSILLNISACNATNPVVLQSYGTGRATIAPTGATDTYNLGLFEAINQCGITVDNLAWVATAGVPWKNGIFFANGNANMLGGIKVPRNDISGIMSNPNFNEAAIFLVAFGGNGSGFTSPIVNDNVIHDLWGDSAHTVDYWSGIGMEGFGGSLITNCVLNGNTIYNTGGGPGSGIGLTGTTGCQARFNLLHDLGRNTHSCGSYAGIETYAGGSGGTTSFTDQTVISDNEIYNIGPSTLNGNECDMAGVDCDIGVTSCVVEHNYIHDNAGPCMESLATSAIFRYNTCINNSKTIGGRTENAPQIMNSPKSGGNSWWVYGNTVVGNQSLPANYGDTGISVAYGGTLVEGGVLDNIFVIGCSNLPIAFARMDSGATGGLSYMDYNNYYSLNGGCAQTCGAAYSMQYSLGAWTAQSGGFDSHATNADPKLVSPTANPISAWTPSSADTVGPRGSGSPSGLHLNTGSPMVGVGVNPAASPYNQPAATQDYYGANVPNACSGTGYNIGADNQCR